jgi:hypothetical protein
MPLRASEVFDAGAGEKFQGSQKKIYGGFI